MTDGLGRRDTVRLAWRLRRDPRVPGWQKWLPVVVAAAYVVMPLDLVPDVFLVIGQVDDLGVVGLMLASLALLPRVAPRQVVEEHLVAMGRGRRESIQRDARRGSPSGTTGGEVIDTPYHVR
ncbi:MAG: hypothetical protein AVDCRST_MAG70-851 [uncultured Thermomicrobiales bacterium]|uniref:DUF1232 domain-containing protein n=1 Tax=uncultured Thermomicrobiales bacterium TaxID=1645740 RepID=A0A6J4UGF4_9BACT|nr:MAG: hypothetical protein AVDCRST_MAG70-851 [uncultured Thermomicrobiales bacterium]